MNLLKLFNKKFLLQNLKKSKAVLAVFLGIIPILNFVILAVNSNNSKTIGHIFSLGEISIINIIGMYIIPIVLSICLFGFVFKKKSVDFINSLPISRKSIFVTNTIGGMLILFSIILINMLGYGLIGLIFENVFIPFQMLLYYLLIWSISYIFVFTSTNLAMTISGNAITQIVVTMLILFLVPLISDYLYYRLNSSATSEITCIEEDCKPTTYYCYDDDVCLFNKSVGIYNSYIEKEENFEYTMPYNLIRSGVFEVLDENLHYNKSVIIMSILTVIYSIGGIFLFNRRKMEVSETSFKSIHSHSIVKCLTLLPFLVIFSELLKLEAYISIFFIGLIILLAYYFIYDVVTRRGIREIKISLIYFIATAITVFCLVSIIAAFGENKVNRLDVKDIKSISLEYEDYYSTQNQKNIFSDIKISDKKAINMVMKYTLESDYSFEKDEITTAKFKIHLSNGKKYYTTINIPESEYKSIKKKVLNHKDYIKNYKAYDFDKVFAIKLGEYTLNAKKYSSLIKLAKQEVNNSLFDGDSKYYRTISFYTYEKGELRVLEIKMNLSAEFEEEITKFYNQKSYETLKSDGSYNFGIDFYEKNISLNEYSYLMSYANNEMIEFLRTATRKTIDLNQPYIVISFYDYYEGINNYVYINEIDKYEEIISNARKKAENTDEYLDQKELFNDELKSMEAFND